MSRCEDEVLFGGAAGGGKSDALVIEALRQVHIPQYKGLLMRKTYPQLSEIIDKSHNYYKRVCPKAKFNDSKHVWTFPSGAKIVFGSLQHSKDKHNYQGKAFDFIGVDEATHFTEEEYVYLLSRNRPNCADTQVYMRLTANPGGIGHAWVKSRFISPVPPMTRQIISVDVPKEDGSIEKREMTRMFVPSSLYDNKKLMENDPQYIVRLASLPEAERNALLYGNWDSFEGQVFAEWKNDSSHYDDMRYTHVIKPFEIPSSWQIWRGFDFGYAKPFSVGWYACDHDGCLFRIAELYGCTGEANVGVKWTCQEIAKAIKDIEATDHNLIGRKIHGIADPSIFDCSRGESVAMQMEREGIYWQGADNTRLAGKMQFHYRLAFDERGFPMFYCFDTCRHFIRTIPSLVYSQTKVEDVDTTMEDHIYDECRYVFMERPISPRITKPMVDRLGEDPLNLRERG